MRKAALILFLAAVATVLARSTDSCLYIQSPGDTLTVVPSEYVVGYTKDADGVSVMLVTGKTLVLPDAESIAEDCPVSLPGFASYQFSKKHNDQLFKSVTASEGELLRDTVCLSVGQIGKYLTATFMFSDEEATAWVGSVRQESNVTRQRMSEPVTYTIGHAGWRLLQIAEDETGATSYSYIPFGRRTTVCVDFLTDHPTGRYNVPRIDITTATGSVPLSKSTYTSATIAIDGGGVYPDMPTTDILIKGRGNSSWSNSSSSKNPYHFKFAEKQKPLGMTAGKHWVLIANKQTGSMLCNALEQKASALAGCAAVCHIVPVELYINGSYRGSYNLTEKVGIHNNSVSLDDESCAAMLELDTYTDEPIWRSNAYNICTKIHDPDFDDSDTGLAITKADVIADWNRTTETLRNGGKEDYTGRFDVNRLVSYLLSNELCYNTELQHPKSVFLYSENVLDNGFELMGVDETPWVFGPMWDCDWSFGYMVGSSSYFVNAAESEYYSGWLKPLLNGFWYDLRYKSLEVDKAYFTLWHHFMNDGRMQELIDYVDDYYNYAAPSLKHNSESVVSERDPSAYAVIARRASAWFRKRADYVYSKLTPYDIEEEQEAEVAVPRIIDTADGIGSLVSGVASGRGNIYNLSGQRVDKMQRGISIVGGKKVLKP